MLLDDGQGERMDRDDNRTGARGDASVEGIVGDGRRQKGDWLLHSPTAAWSQDLTKTNDLFPHILSQLLIHSQNIAFVTVFPCRSPVLCLNPFYKFTTYFL